MNDKISLSRKDIITTQWNTDVIGGSTLGLILGLHPVNEIRLYKVTPSLIERKPRISPDIGCIGSCHLECLQHSLYPLYIYTLISLPFRNFALPAKHSRGKILAVNNVNLFKICDYKIRKRIYKDQPVFHDTRSIRSWYDRSYEGCFAVYFMFRHFVYLTEIVWLFFFRSMAVVRFHRAALIDQLVW